MAASTADSTRAFIAIALGPGLVAELQKLRRRLETRLPGKGVRWAGAEQVHLTLKFLGNVTADRIDELVVALNRACRDTSQFQLALEGIGCFPGASNPRVVWLGINGDLDALQQLRSRIEQETQGFGDHAEERAFQPHLTIARVRTRGQEARRVGKMVESGPVPKLGDWSVREIHLMRSELSPQGALYTTLATAALINANTTIPLTPSADTLLPLARRETTG